jgi:hypothetical protein
VSPRVDESNRGGGSDELARGLALLRARRWHDAHEALEAAWTAEPVGPRREALRGLVNGAVAFVHLERGNRIGARLQATKCVRRLEDAALGDELRLWARAVHAIAGLDDPPPATAWPVPGAGRG